MNTSAVFHFPSFVATSIFMCDDGMFNFIPKIGFVLLSLLRTDKQFPQYKCLSFKNSHSGKVALFESPNIVVDTSFSILRFDLHHTTKRLNTKVSTVYLCSETTLWLINTASPDIEVQSGLQRLHRFVQCRG